MFRSRGPVDMGNFILFLLNESSLEPVSALMARLSIEVRCDAAIPLAAPTVTLRRCHIYNQQRETVIASRIS